MVDVPNDRGEPAFDPIKGHLWELDRAIVARGGWSIFAVKGPAVMPTVPALFRQWETEKLGPVLPKPDPDDGFYRRISSRGKLHLVRRTA